MSLSTFVKLFGFVFINILKYLEANVRKNVQITLETRHLPEFGIYCPVCGWSPGDFNHFFKIKIETTR